MAPYLQSKRKLQVLHLKRDYMFQSKSCSRDEQKYNFIVKGEIIVMQSAHRCHIPPFVSVENKANKMLKVMLSLQRISECNAARAALSATQENARNVCLDHENRTMLLGFVFVFTMIIKL